jgi:hypothetical protein
MKTLVFSAFTALVLASLNVKRGETIRFVVKNEGKLLRANRVCLPDSWPFRSRHDRKGDSKMNRRHLLLGLAALPLIQAVPSLAAASSVVVYKNPSCGCCSGWVEHLRSSGFPVTVRDVADTAPERERLGLPERYGGCHTATVEGYVLEGHVPAADVQRLLATRPDAIGLAVPGMPVGSPGMEVDGRVDPFEVLLVDRHGQASVFARYPKS